MIDESRRSQSVMTCRIIIYLLAIDQVREPHHLRIRQRQITARSVKSDAQHRRMWWRIAADPMMFL